MKLVTRAQGSEAALAAALITRGRVSVKGQRDKAKGCAPSEKSRVAKHTPRANGPEPFLLLRNLFFTVAKEAFKHPNTLVAVDAVQMRLVGIPWRHVGTYRYARGWTTTGSISAKR